MLGRVTVLSALCIIITQSRPPQGAPDEIVQCLTPNSTHGFCINLQMCPSIFQVSNDFKRPITIETLQFLINSQCGFNGTTPKVCCPVTDPSISFLLNTIEGFSNSIPDQTLKNLPKVEPDTKNLDNGTPCLTPNSTAGQCILFDSCPVLYKMSDDLMNSTDYSNPEFVDKFMHLKNSLCGFNITMPKVCCPLD